MMAYQIDVMKEATVRLAEGVSGGRALTPAIVGEVSM
jgi:hypothetical protein